MTTKYKVGHVTEFGILMAESLKPAKTLKIDQIVSMYKIPGEETYIIIEWVVTDGMVEDMTSRDEFDNIDRAWRTYLGRVFGIFW